MSKRQKKKILKLKKFEERKKNLRKKEKEKKKLKKVVAKEQGLEIPRSTHSRKMLKANKIENNPADISVAIDLSFDELMIDKDLGSCAAQLMRVYTDNRRAKQPIPLHFTGLNEEGKLYEKLEKNEGWKNWDVKRHKESFMELFDKDKIIYLTSESDNVLDVLEKGATYVIGGLVDHNHHKSLTYEIAQKKKIRTARLPLGEHLVIKTRTVLTINQCFEIILGVSEGMSWKETLLKVMPSRKKIKAKNDDDEAEVKEEMKIESESESG
jgi:tRNA (guanine9-N1)-methyltransferase